jgi:hypothetical protein
MRNLFLAGKKKRHHGTDPVDDCRDSGFAAVFTDAGGQPFGEKFEFFIKRWIALNDVKCCQSRGDGAGVAGQGARLIDLACRGDMTHDVAGAAIGPHGQPAADNLAERGDVGNAVVKLLRAAGGEPEPGDDFVENEKRAASFRDVAQALQKSRLWRNNAHVAGHWFDNDSSDGFAVPFKQGRKRLNIIVGGY